MYIYQYMYKQMGATIHGKMRILIIGFGALGKETAKLLRGSKSPVIQRSRNLCSNVSKSRILVFRYFKTENY